ncbi:uncharacterized protein LOC108664684 [Hyalella azteca]|uniref:Uncharacterized protein LOC108664684 n=1 Tax=Hyalella azteca TaxID=294128 RepID=A0A8B7N0U7_HYAAZ|nr:uncharacterized protein LOC108664684 [Hyalella azteca]
MQYFLLPLNALFPVILNSVFPVILYAVLGNFVRVIPTSCTTGLGGFATGTCLSISECASLGGTATTTCAMNFGTCCVLRQICSQTVTSSTTSYFTNPSYPNTDNSVAGGSCSIAILPCQNNICQIRIDFIDVNLIMPENSNGKCAYDKLIITGNGANSGKIPTLCGNLTGQHIYIDVEPTCSPTNINVQVYAPQLDARKFNMKVTQIPCLSQDLAPAGCLQYYNSTSGTIKSFNYGSVNGLIETQNYATCIASQPGFCSITWRKTADSSFQLPGTCAPTSECCVNAYVLVPGATCQGLAFSNACTIKDPRFCGNSFPTTDTTETVSWHKPFALYAHIPKSLGQFYAGYSLDYSLNRCT